MSDHPQHIRDAMPGETTPISVRDSATGAVVPSVGDAANAAVRVNIVAGAPAATSNVNLQQVGGTPTSVNNGTTDAGTLRVTISSDSTGQVIANAPALITSAFDISAVAQTAQIALPNGNGSVMMDIESIGNGGTLQCEASADGGATWSSITMTPVSFARIPSAFFSSAIGPTQSPGVGLTHFRVRCSAFTGPGHITGTISAGSGTVSSGVGARALLVQNLSSALAVAAGPSQSTNASNPAVLAVGIQAQFDDAGTTLLTENNWGNLRVSTRRELYTQIRDAAGNERGANVTANNAMLVSPLALGTALSVGNGTTDTGTQRVTISSDSTGQVALAAGAQIIGSLAANQSVNVAQVAGTTTSVNNGTTDAGTQRVTISSDSTGQVKLAAGVAVIGSLAANQSVNVAQVAGTATSVNNGTTDVGTQRVTISSDSTGQVALAAGAAAIGSVVVTSVVPGTGPTNLGKAEDLPHASGDTGIEMLGVRNELAATFNDNEQDYTPMAMSRQGFVYTQDNVNAPSTAVLRAQDQRDLAIYVAQMIALMGSGTDTYAENFARGFELR